MNKKAHTIYTTQDFLNNIREEDTLITFCTRTKINQMTIIRRFGSWNNLREVAGFKRRAANRPRKKGETYV